MCLSVLQGSELVSVHRAVSAGVGHPCDCSVWLWKIYWLLLNFISSHFCLTSSVRSPHLALSVFISLFRIPGRNSAWEIILRNLLNQSSTQTPSSVPQLLFFFFCDNQKDNSLGKVTITLHWGRIYSQYKNCTFYLVYSRVFLMVVPQLPLLGEYSIV